MNFIGQNIVWSFKSENIKDSNIELSTGVTVSNFEETKENPQNIQDGVKIEFKHEGILPGKATVRIEIGINKFGNTKKSLLLYYCNEKTKEYEYMQEVNYEEGEVEFEIEHCSSYVLVEKSPFVDVPINTYFYPAVYYCNRKNIILGTSATTFKPNDDLTRGMLVTIIWRMEGSKHVNTNMKFEDVKQDRYYYEAVKWATENKVVNGYKDGTFKPSKSITREELVTMLKNYADYKKIDTSARANISKFADSNGIADYAIAPVKWAVAKKVVSGKFEGTKLDPRGTASRAEAAVMIYNFCRNVL